VFARIAFFLRFQIFQRTFQIIQETHLT
jgi:hypothetical protein